MRCPRVFEVSTVAAVAALICTNLAAQSVTTAAPPPTKMTAPAPQNHRPPGGQHPVPAGNIYGFVYWDARATSHLGPSICGALTITVAVANKGSYSPFGVVGTQSHLTSIATVHPPLMSVNTTSYDGCAYSYSNALLGQNLYVKLNLTQPVGQLMPATVAKNPAVGPIQFSNAPCSKLPPLTKATIADLTGKWGSCQNVAYDVNLPLVILPQLTVPGTSGGLGGASGGPTGSGGVVSLTPVGSGNQPGMLSSAPPRGMLAQGAASGMPLPQAPGGQQPVGQAPSPQIANAPPQLKMHASGQGVIIGYVYWDTTTLQYARSTPCKGLDITVNVGTQLQTFGNYHAFTSMPPVGSLAVCAYSVHNVPTGQDIQVLAKADPTIFLAVGGSVTVPPPTANNPNGLINIPGGTCNKVAPAVPSAQVLGSGWWTCGIYAYNVNFVVQRRNPPNLPHPGNTKPLLPAKGPGGVSYP